jgi:hypothetical protein
MQRWVCPHRGFSECAKIPRFWKTRKSPLLMAPPVPFKNKPVVEGLCRASNSCRSPQNRILVSWAQTGTSLRID